MPRKCSNCGNTGHNSRTCSISSPSSSSSQQQQQLMKLKGKSSEIMIGPSSTSIDDDYFSSSSSSPFSVSEFVQEMMDLTSLPTSVAYSWTEATRFAKSCSLACELDKMIRENNQAAAARISHQDQYYSETNKGGPWSEEEHQRFLQGVEELGKGNWKGISENFVTTRTRNQVASHGPG